MPKEWVELETSRSEGVSKRFEEEVHADVGAVKGADRAYASALEAAGAFISGERAKYLEEPRPDDPERGGGQQRPLGPGFDKPVSGGSVDLAELAEYLARLPAMRGAMGGTPAGAGLDFWTVFIYASAFMGLVARMKASGLSGQIHTRIVATSPDGQESEFPFVTITV